MFGPDFYPTPRPVIQKMLAALTNKEAHHYLEPSAGKGDIAEAIRGDSRDYGRKPSVDCIELNPDLAGIIREKDFSLVGYDWLSYAGVCYYDAIVMNPPFSAGAEHLLRAWDFMHDGEIVCLLNEETIKNPYTAERLRLAGILAAHGTVEFLGPCFDTAIRKTDVNVALVHLTKKSEDDTIEAWATAGQEKSVNDSIDSPENLLAIRDELGNMEHYYNEATTHMLKAFRHIRQASLYLHANGIHLGNDYDKILGLSTGNMNSARAEFARLHRKDCWKMVFEKMQFHKWLDKKQREQFLRDLERDADIPFTADNIKGTLENVFLQRRKLFDMSVWNVFEELTRYFKGNTNYQEGWKSNDSFKVNEKLVFPYGCEWDSIFHKFRLRWSGSSIDIYNDLDRILAVLDGEKFEEILTVHSALHYRFDGRGNGCSEPGKASSRYFDIRFFKKGTVHLKWKRPDLLEAFSIKAAAGRKWIGENTQGRGTAA